ncbi:MAG TPA: hypothetical protein VMD91_11795 [Candidatus Sulfotelmatobacter sp.]|nr:hypothetical protein [Candidatus Sulfotelmatobacter sp.]
MRFFGCLATGMLGVVLTFGVIALVAGVVQLPRDVALAQAYAKAACVRAQSPSAAECVRVPVDVVTVMGPIATPSQRTATAANVTVRFPDGTQQTEDLGGANVHAFVQSVYPGTAGEATVFRGALVHLTAGGVATDLASTPAVRVASDRVLPWAGGGILAVGLVLVVVVRRLLRWLQAQIDGERGATRISPS